MPTSKTKKIIVGIAVAGALTLGADQLLQERPNVKTVDEARIKVEAEEAEYIVDDSTPQATKRYLWANVTKQNKGNVRYTK